jgi:hypothetical protein
MLMDSGEALIREIVERFGNLDPIYRTHIGDNNGETLPHVLFWDLTNAIVRSFLGTDPHLEWRDFLLFLDDEYRRGDSYVRGILEVSFLENLPYPNEAGSGIVESLPVGLRNVFDRIRPAG